MENQFEILQKKYELLEEKYAEKSFKFLTIHQITKTIANETDITNLKKIILDMLFEVSFVKRGLCFEIKNNNLVFLDSKNYQEFSVGHEISLENRKNEVEFLNQISMIEIKKLKEKNVLPEIFDTFDEGNCLVFLGNNSEFETIFIVLGEKAYGEYTEVDDEFLVTIRGQVDIILENAIKTFMIEKKNKELIEKNFNLQLINEFAIRLGSTLETSTLYSYIKNLITEKFKTKDVVTFFYDEETNGLIVEGEYEEAERFHNIYLSDMDGASLSHLYYGIIGVGHDEFEISNIHKKISFELSKNNHKGINYTIPLLSNGNMLGLIGFKSNEILDLVFLETLKQQMSMYLYNGMLYTMAITDSMTKLYLQTYFKERIEGEVIRYERYNQEFSLIILDIDHFKKFNDTYGHLVGDFVLKEVAKIIKVSVRKFDIVSRYGGEEFGVMLLNTAAETAITVAERIRKNIEERVFTYNKNNMKVTISGGVANIKNVESKEQNEIIRLADEALYVSKNSGRNKITLYAKKEN